MKYIFFIYHFFCSLKLALLTITSFIILFAIGTFYESFHGRAAAQEIIYNSIWMTILVSIFALNIIAVMIDRWPWNKTHISFLFAHFGLIIVIIGSLLTRFYGVDGNMRLALQKTGKYITTSSTSLMVYSSFDAQNMTELYQEQVYFFRHPPTQKKPHKIQLGSNILSINQFYIAATAREKYSPALRGGPALYFQISGAKANIVKWIFKPVWKNKIQLPLGPAQIFLLNSFSSVKKIEIDRPSLLLVSSKKKLLYELRKPNSKKVLRGSLKKGSIIKTKWMDFTFRVLEYLPIALPEPIFTAQKKSGDNTNAAIQVEFKGEKRWMGLNSHLFFFDKNKVYVVAYLNTKQNLGFQIKLKNFKVIRYPASFKALSYESTVLINKKTYLISMNEPLKMGAYTIYQSGMEEDKNGIPIASVFSINKDPGRWVKYFGSTLIILGSILLFIRRNRRIL